MSTNPPPLYKGPGTCLQEILHNLGIHPENCECRERAEEMDVLGPEGCSLPENFNRIVGWLRGEQAKRGWIKYFQTIDKAIHSGEWKALVKRRINPIDAAPGLVQWAIDMSRESFQQP
jgi:hypothetical protein